MKIFRERALIVNDIHQMDVFLSTCKKELAKANKNVEPLDAEIKTLNARQRKIQSDMRNHSNISLPDAQAEVNRLGQLIRAKYETLKKWEDYEKSQISLITQYKPKREVLEKELRTFERVEFTVDYIVTQLKYTPELVCMLGYKPACIISYAIMAGEALYKLYDLKDAASKGEPLGMKFIEIGEFIFDEKLSISKRLTKDKVKYIINVLKDEFQITAKCAYK